MGKDGRLLGMITQSNLLEHWLVALGDGNSTLDPLAASPIIAYDLIESQPETAYPDERCRETAERLATSGNRRLPVVSLQDSTRLVGIVPIVDLLKARLRILDEEATR